MPMKDTMIIFDLDGTLWDSAAQVAQSWNEVLADIVPEQAKLTAFDVKSVMGKTMDEIARVLLPEGEDSFRKMVFAKCFVHENEYVEKKGGVLFEGVEETLKKLAEDGYKMAIVSNCQKGYINAFIVSMNMGKYFCDFEEWGATGLSKGENIRLVMERNGFEKAVYVGDTSGDESASRQAGIPFIYAEYGFGSVQSPDGVISEFGQLPEKVEEVLSLER